MDLFRKKSVDQLVSESTPLKRTLKTFDLTMLGIGAIIGTGIFVLTGKGALTAGPALCVSFLLAAVCCGFAGLCYAEFAAMAPVSGSAYSYAYLAFGELIAFVIGWDLILEYALQAATVSAGWSGYFNKLLEGFGLHLPVELTAAYGTNPDVTTYFNLPGFVIVLIITWVLSIGINQTKRTNDVMVLIKLAIIVLFIVCTVWYINPANWKPFSPYGIYTFQPGSTQPYGIVPAASIVFFSFIGFDAVSSSAEETINPNKTLPRGILISLAVSTVLYIIMTLIMTGVVPYKEFAKFIDAPVAGVILETGLNWLAFIVYFVVGASCGYVQLRNSEAIRAERDQNELVRNRNTFLTQLYHDAIEDKRAYRRQIVGRHDSFGKIFAVTQELDVLNPRDIYRKCCELLGEILENDSVAIYHVSGGAFARLVAASPAIAENAARSLTLEQLAPLLGDGGRSNLWVNRELTPGFPMFGYAIERDPPC